MLRLNARSRRLESDRKIQLSGEHFTDLAPIGLARSSQKEVSWHFLTVSSNRQLEQVFCSAGANDADSLRRLAANPLLRAGALKNAFGRWIDVELVLKKNQ